MSLPRPCLGCGELVRGRPRCPPCTPAKRPNAQRGYGATHNRLRAELVASYHPLDPCPRCDEPLGPDPSLLDLDHTADRRGYLGLSHASCNRAAGARAKF